MLSGVTAACSKRSVRDKEHLSFSVHRNTKDSRFQTSYTSSPWRLLFLGLGVKKVSEVNSCAVLLFKKMITKR
jgi:hypothetical protein